MRVKIPDLSATAWVALLSASIAPVAISIVILLSGQIQNISFEENIEENINTRILIISGIAATPILTNQNKQESLDEIENTGSVHGILIKDIDGANIVSRNYPCEFEDIIVEKHNYHWEDEYLCLFFPVKLISTDTPNSVYEEKMFGKGIDDLEGYTEIIGYVGVAYSVNDSSLENTLVLVMIFVVFVTVCASLLGIRIVIGQSFFLVLKHIRKSDTDSLRELVLNNRRIMVKEVREIGGAYLMQEKRSNHLGDSLLLVSESGDTKALEMAGEIHDKLCAQLNYTKRLIENTKPEIPVGNVKKILISHVDETDRVARSIIGRGRHDVTEALGLEAGLREIASSFSDERISMFYRADVEPEKKYHKHIGKVVHEALRNAVIHSGAMKIKVLIEEPDDPQYIGLKVVDCTIWDDGEGFDFEDEHKGRYGIMLMRERCARVFGSSLTIISTSGTSIKFRVGLN